MSERKLDAMKLTKHGHACLVLEQDGKRLIIDPGAYTEELPATENTLAVVLTHAHDDHCFEAQLEKIKAQNSAVEIFGTAEVAKRLTGFKVTTVYHGDFHQVGPFSLEFFGDLHQEIHRSIPLIQNTAVLINDSLYYAGDSYTLPDRQVKVLACPTSAPWLKIGDVMDFVAEIKPKQCFATHNALLSDLGHDLNNSRVKLVTEQYGGKFTYLKVGESLNI
jgi:L-ascorbate metabolism protein UlaG (beta-lactamase superfamily)